MFNEKNKSEKSDPLKQINKVQITEIKPTIIPLKPQVTEVRPTNAITPKNHKQKITFGEDEEDEVPVKLSEIKANKQTVIPVERKKIIVDPLEKRKSVTKPIFFEDEDEVANIGKQKEVKEDKKEFKEDKKDKKEVKDVKESNPIRQPRQKTYNTNIVETKDNNSNDYSSLKVENKPNEIIDNSRKESNHSLKDTVAMFEKKDKANNK